MILCLGMTPALQRVMVFKNLAIDSVNRAILTLDGPAGKSINVAKVLKTLNETVVACGFYGGERGRNILSALLKHRVVTEFVEVASTRQCVTVIDESAGTHTELVEESPSVTPQECKQLFDIFQQLISVNCRAVVLSGTLAPGANPDFYFQCLMHANKKGLFTAIDAQKEPLLKALDAKPDLIKPNIHELGWTLGENLQTETQLIAAMRKVHQLGAQRVVITAGANPTLAFDGELWWRIIPPKIKPLNPIGSGDSAMAAILVHLLKGDELGEAARWGSAAGAANTLTHMAGQIDVNEMNKLAENVVVEKISV